jgi:hypothetical protein
MVACYVWAVVLLALVQVLHPHLHHLPLRHRHPAAQSAIDFDFPAHDAKARERDRPKEVAAVAPGADAHDAREQPVGQRRVAVGGAGGWASVVMV